VIKLLIVGTCCDREAAARVGHSWRWLQQKRLSALRSVKMLKQAPLRLACLLQVVPPSTAAAGGVWVRPAHLLRSTVYMSMSIAVAVVVGM
jgi:hypothetical protein